MNCFAIVEQFEKAVAAFAGARHGVAVNTGTNALFLSLEYLKGGDPVILPANTFISVPMACVHAGYRIHFEDIEWRGSYQLYPYSVVDGALRFRKGMYQGGLHCLSFHARKILNIGEGGMVLTDDDEAAEWLRKARYSGRSGDYSVENIEMLGWQMYMTPEKAARGLHLMEYVEDEPDQVMTYPDLRKVKALWAFSTSPVFPTDSQNQSVSTLPRSSSVTRFPSERIAA